MTFPTKITIYSRHRVKNNEAYVMFFVESKRPERSYGDAVTTLKEGHPEEAHEVG